MQRHVQRQSSPAELQAPHALTHMHAGTDAQPHVLVGFSNTAYIAALKGGAPAPGHLLERHGVGLELHQHGVSGAIGRGGPELPAGGVGAGHDIGDRAQQVLRCTSSNISSD